MRTLRRAADPPRAVRGRKLALLGADLLDSGLDCGERVGRAQLGERAAVL